MSPNQPNAFETFWIAAITGAVLIDLYLVISEVYVLHLASVAVLFQWDASNVLGASAFSGGLGTETFGTLLHLIVSTIWAAVFVFGVLRLKSMAGYPIISGALFGLCVWAVMHYVVVPLGSARLPAYTPVTLANILVAHILFFGVPLGVAARRFASRQANAT